MMTRDERQKLRDASLAAANDAHVDARQAELEVCHVQPAAKAFRRIGAHDDDGLCRTKPPTVLAWRRSNAS